MLEDGRTAVEWISKKQAIGRDYIHVSGQTPLTGISEHDAERTGSIKGDDFFNQLIEWSSDFATPLPHTGCTENNVTKKTKNEVCSNSIRFGIVVVVHWVGCVCNQS